MPIDAFQQLVHLVLDLLLLSHAGTAYANVQANWAGVGACFPDFTVFLASLGVDSVSVVLQAHVAETVPAGCGGGGTTRSLAV